MKIKDLPKPIRWTLLTAIFSVQMHNPPGACPSHPQGTNVYPDNAEGIVPQLNIVYDAAETVYETLSRTVTY